MTHLIAADKASSVVWCIARASLLTPLIVLSLALMVMLLALVVLNLAVEAFLVAVVVLPLPLAVLLRSLVRKPVALVELKASREVAVGAVVVYLFVEAVLLTVHVTSSVIQVVSPTRFNTQRPEDRTPGGSNLSGRGV